MDQAEIVPSEEQLDFAEAQPTTPKPANNKTPSPPNASQPRQPPSSFLQLDFSKKTHTSSPIVHIARPNNRPLLRSNPHKLSKLIPKLISPYAKSNTRPAPSEPEQPHLTNPPSSPTHSGHAPHFLQPVNDSQMESAEQTTDTAPPNEPNIQHPKDNAGPKDTRNLAEIVRTSQSTSSPYIFKPEATQAVGSISEIEGMKVVNFTDVDNEVLAGHLGHAVVGKFSHSLPTRHQIQKVLGNVNLVGTYTLKHLNAKHVLIELSELCDYVKILCGHNGSSTWYIDHHPMRVFKWTPDFDPFFESPIIPLWCNLPGLPIHLFHESALLTIGRCLGKPVQADRATITRARVSFARICIEVDISRPLPDSFTIHVAGKEHCQRVIWDRVPLYCTDCKHVGHSEDKCYAFGKRPKPVRRDYTTPKGNQNAAPRQSVVAGQMQENKFKDGHTVQRGGQHPKKTAVTDQTQSSSDGDTDADGFTRVRRKPRRRNPSRRRKDAEDSSAPRQGVGGSGSGSKGTEDSSAPRREVGGSVSGSKGTEDSSAHGTPPNPRREDRGSRSGSKGTEDSSAARGTGSSSKGPGSSSAAEDGELRIGSEGHDEDRTRILSSNPGRNKNGNSLANRDRDRRSLSPSKLRRDDNKEPGRVRSEAEWRAQQEALAGVHLITNNAYEALATEEEEGMLDDSDMDVIEEEDERMVEASASRAHLLKAPRSHTKNGGSRLDASSTNDVAHV